MESKKGFYLVCDIPEEAGKLLQSGVFFGVLFLAFENGIYRVKDGKACLVGVLRNV